MFVVKYICDYMTERGYPTSAISSFKTCWKTIVRDHINKLNEHVFIEERLILPDSELDFEYSDEYRRVWLNHDDLWVASVVPAWRQNWRGIIRNDIVSDVVDSYFFFLTQYWHRCNCTPIIVYLLYKYGITSEWIGSPSVIQKPNSKIDWQMNNKNKPFHAFLTQVDCDYPLVHNACYHYIRMKSLLNANFYEDAFVNMDSIASIARQRSAQINSGIIDLNNLGLNQKQENDLEKLHKLRSRFAAHPSRTKWWDFGELFENEIDEYEELIFLVLLKIASSYQDERKIEKTFDAISHAVADFHDCFWFNKIPI